MNPSPLNAGWLQFLVDHQLTQPAVTMLVGALAALFAWVAIVTNRWSARMRATLDMLERLEATEYYQKRYRAFRKVRVEANGIHRIIQISRSDQETERDHCLDFLNMYEFLALGIRKRILDDRFLRGAYGAPLLRDWVAAKPLIDDVRQPADQGAGQGQPSAFEHFEWLVDRWRRPVPPWRRVGRRVVRAWAALTRS